MTFPAYTPAMRRMHHRRKPYVSSRPSPAGLVLISATFNGTFTINLVFDRAIDVSGFNGPAITLIDGPDGLLWQGQNATLLSDVSVRISLTNTGGATGDDVLLTATAASGIVASDDGGTWSGCSDLVLPFG